MRSDWMHAGKRQEWKNWHRRLFYKFIIKHYLKDCNSFLDVGCGTCLFLDCVPEDKYLAGIDLEPVNTCESCYHYNLIKGDYLTWKKNVDCVFASQFIEHVDGTEFVKWATKTARKRMVIITGRPSASFWDDASHIRPYTKKAVRCLLEESGWRIVLNINLWPTQAHITIAEKR